MIVFLVHPDKHVSRESRKLTVMMRQELVSYSVTKYKSLAISPHYVIGRPSPGQAFTAPKFG